MCVSFMLARSRCYYPLVHVCFYDVCLLLTCCVVLCLSAAIFFDATLFFVVLCELRRFHSRSSVCLYSCLSLLSVGAGRRREGGRGEARSRDRRTLSFYRALFHCSLLFHVRFPSWPCFFPVFLWPVSQALFCLFSPCPSPFPSGVKHGFR